MPKQVFINGCGENLHVQRAEKPVGTLTGALERL